ncbi:hypothetical protein SAMN02910356_01098 [Selenomonas sp. GACV-9]|nr:hypothetical protein SAMN02910356_01098 [Selenomonas ruminantium]
MFKTADYKCSPIMASYAKAEKITTYQHKQRHMPTINKTKHIIIKKIALHEFGSATKLNAVSNYYCDDSYALDNIQIGIAFFYFHAINSLTLSPHGIV